MAALHTHLASVIVAPEGVALSAGTYIYACNPVGMFG